MKKFAKFLSVLAGTVVLMAGAVSCSDDEGSSGAAGVFLPASVGVDELKGRSFITENGFADYESYTFNEDGTLTVEESYDEEEPNIISVYKYTYNSETKEINLALIKTGDEEMGTHTQSEWYSMMANDKEYFKEEWEEDSQLQNEFLTWEAYYADVLRNTIFNFTVRKSYSYENTSKGIKLTSKYVCVEDSWFVGNGGNGIGKVEIDPLNCQGENLHLNGVEYTCAKDYLTKTLIFKAYGVEPITASFEVDYTAISPVMTVTFTSGSVKDQKVTLLYEPLVYDLVEVEEE